MFKVGLVCVSSIFHLQTAALHCSQVFHNFWVEIRNASLQGKHVEAIRSIFRIYNTSFYVSATVFVHSPREKNWVLIVPWDEFLYPLSLDVNALFSQPSLHYCVCGLANFNCDQRLVPARPGVSNSNRTRAKRIVLKSMAGRTSFSAI
jgi:hypothetical protein